MKVRLGMMVRALASLLILATSRDGDSAKTSVSSKESAHESMNVPSKAYKSIRKKIVKNVPKGTTEWYIILFALIAVLVVSSYSPSQALPSVLLLLYILFAFTAPDEMPTRRSLKRGISMNYSH